MFKYSIKSNCNIHVIKFDEVSLNGVSAEVFGILIYTDMPVYDKDIYRRLHLKLNEFNQTICTEIDEMAREEKWQNLVKEEKQPSANENTNITQIDDYEIFNEKVNYDPI